MITKRQPMQRMFPALFTMFWHILFPRTNLHFLFSDEINSQLFEMLVSLLQSGPLRQLLTFNMELWECHCQVVDRLLYLVMPDLQQALHRHGVTVNLFLYPWFQVQSSCVH